MNPGPSRARRTCHARLPFRAGGFREGAFTLIELLVVMGIIAVLLVLIAPAFTTLKSGADATSAAYTIKGVLDQARTYAMANNTYTWVGFFEENVSNPTSPNSDTPAIGRLIMSIVASKDGTTIYPQPLTTTSPLDPARLIQLGKLTKIDNFHLQTFPDATATPPPDTFATRPSVAASGSSTARIGSTTPNASHSPFQYPVGSAVTAQYTFTKVVQFSPLGEARIDNNSDYGLQEVIEVGVEPTHGTALDTNPANPQNPVAIQITGAGGNVKIYRR